MARSRNIKPGFFKNEYLGVMDPMAHLLFAGLWTLADFRGNLEYRPLKIKNELFGFRDCDVEKLVEALRAPVDHKGTPRFVEVYDINGQRFIHITNFTKHQNPHKNERSSGSQIPEPQQHTQLALPSTVLVPSQDGTAPADSLILIPDSLILIPDVPNAASGDEVPAGDPSGPSVANAPTTASPPQKESNLSTSKEKPERVSQDVLQDLLEAYNAAVPKIPNARKGMPWKSAPTLQKSALARLKEPWWVDNYKKALDRAPKSKFLRGECAPTKRFPKKFKFNMEFFLGPDSVSKILAGNYDNPEDGTDEFVRGGDPTE